MSYYFEIWLRDNIKECLRNLSESKSESYHPHIILVRPFSIISDEFYVKEKVVDFCKGKSPIGFCLEKSGNFGGNIQFIQVTGCEKLLEFNDSLELLLKDDVSFVEKLNEQKILHATVPVDGPIVFPYQFEEQMLRFTGIKDKKIWFSYDFIAQRCLTREESLNTDLWKKTLSDYARLKKIDL